MSDMIDVDEMSGIFNAPMLLSWLFKHVDEELTVLQGLGHLKDHVQTGDGCLLMVKHGAVECVKKIVAAYRLREDVMLLCIAIIRQLLDCNFTREDIIQESTEMLQIAFSIGHSFMNSAEHVEHALKCVMQCSRSENNRAAILNSSMHNYLTMFCKKYSKRPTILRSVLKIFNWVTTDKERMTIVCVQADAVCTVIQCMKRYTMNADILAPGIFFLTRAASFYPPALEYMLRKKALPMIIGALRALQSHDILQLEGLKMIQILSQTKEGWKQISETPGGWQSLCQGTSLGNALVHDLDGSFNNPGWCIGDTHSKPLMERAIAAAKDAEKLRSHTVVVGHWTAQMLFEYMGHAARTQKLKVNTDRHEAYFQLVKTLDLLPDHEEEREYWFIRLKDYEAENDVSLDDMVETILVMKQKENDREKTEAKAKLKSGNEEYVKPVFVLGQKVTSESLAEKDVDVNEKLDGIV